MEKLAQDMKIIRRTDIDISDRDASIDFARIIGCIIVIGVHTLLPVTEANDLSRTFIAALFADGVSVFWLITGAFLFSDTNNYPKVVRRTIHRIVLPLILVSAFLFFFRDWVIYGETIIKSIQHTRSDYTKVVWCIVRFRNPIEGNGALWYLYVYIILMICFPIMASFVKYLDEDINRERLFLFISLVMLTLNDISNNELFGVSNVTISEAVPGGIIIIMGHIIYKHKECIASNKKQVLISALVLFFALNLLRTYIQIQRQQKDLGNQILFWYSSIGIICAACILMICIVVFSGKSGGGSKLDRQLYFSHISNTHASKGFP